MKKATEKVLETAQKNKVSLRESAYIIALKRLQKQFQVTHN